MNVPASLGGFRESEKKNKNLHSNQESLISFKTTPDFNAYKVKSLPKSKPPGIGIDIQGRDIDRYKIRITGARNKYQLEEIVNFMKILIYLYSETYLYKKNKYQKLKSQLSQLNKVAKRRNKVTSRKKLRNYERVISNWRRNNTDL